MPYKHFSKMSYLALDEMFFRQLCKMSSGFVNLTFLRHLAKILSKVSFTIVFKTILLRCLKRCLCRMSYIPLYEMSFRQLCKMQYAKYALSLKIHSQRNYGPESISLFVTVEKSSNSANWKHCLGKVFYQYIYQKFAS